MNSKFQSYSRKPFSPAKSPVFYGWIVLIVGTLGVIASVPGQTIGVSVFTDRLIDALKIPRVDLSMAYMFGTISSALIITKAGRFYDIYGSRFTTIITVIMLAFVLFIFSQIDKISFFLESVISFIDRKYLLIGIFAIAFLGLRFFGQGVLTMASRNMVMKWFEKARGFANAFMGVAIAFGFSYSPVVLNSLIEKYDWKNSWLILSAVLITAVLTIVLIFFRDNPYDSGCQPDGKLAKSKLFQKSSKSHAPKDFTLKEAKRTYSFWIFNLTLSMFALYITATTFHIVSIFETNEMTREQAVSVFLPASVVAVIFHFIGSWLSDFIKLKYLLFVLQIGLLAAMGALIFFDSTECIVYFFIAGLGMANGSHGTLGSVTWPRFFGTKHLGEISGYSLSWLVGGSAIGPFLFSLSKKYTQNYSLSALICFVITAILFIFAFKADNVNRSTE